ncbi:MAG: hypothetical protein U9R40_02680 [Synergistota bacterium]|nr:hypothetical protein [Synergistota bacterium]
MIEKNVADSCITAYMVASSYLKQGEYEKGKDLMKEVLDSDSCYGTPVNIWGETEMLRTLAASELALYAGGEGDVETIEWIEDKVQADAVTDRVAVRDAQGILQGKTKLKDVLRFHKARAFVESGKTDQAKEVLDQLAFSSGKVFVDGEVQGLEEAINAIKQQVGAEVSAILRMYLAA